MHGDVVAALDGKFAIMDQRFNCATVINITGKKDNRSHDRGLVLPVFLLDIRR